MGNLFKRRSIARNRTEVAIFVTPYILRTDEDADAVRERVRNRMNSQLPGAVPDTLGTPLRKKPEIETGDGRREFGDKRHHRPSAPLHSPLHLSRLITPVSRLLLAGTGSPQTEVWRRQTSARSAINPPHSPLHLSRLIPPVSRLPLAGDRRLERAVWRRQTSARPPINPPHSPLHLSRLIPPVSRLASV